jgi:hypothetical protein
MGKLSIAEGPSATRPKRCVTQIHLCGAPLRMTILWEFEEKHPK